MNPMNLMNARLLPDFCLKHGLRRYRRNPRYGFALRLRRLFETHFGPS